ncbi:MAG TPA: isoprenylcysteine carboxylmethyltransferase family protein [Thiotrichaceae bacterium]|nr:isoprenylcysteine carboxylmethyltransferase family protein [Thiotrichaceae bacterium]
MLKNIIPPPVYALLIATLMYSLAKYLPILTLFEPPINQLAYLFVVIGITFDLSSLILFIRSKTTSNPIKPANASKLVITGLYRYSRNPMYAGLFFLLLAWAWYMGALSPFIGLPLFVMVITIQQIQPEEQALESKFGQAYLDYKKKVRRWI